MEVHNIVQEAVNKTIPKKKKSKKAKWLSEEALQIAEEQREVKSKGKVHSIKLRVNVTPHIAWAAIESKKVKVAQSCPTLFDPMEFSRPEYWSG